VRAKPDLIISTQRELPALAQRPGWNTLAAVREQRWCGFESGPYDVLVRPGPRIGEAAGLLADCLVRLGAAASR
jgi:iron complex transport system substrate-binding protein